MAKQTARSGRQAQAPAGGPVPYPADWGRMNTQQRQAWMQSNRPGRNPAATIPAPQQATAAQQPQQAQPQQLGQEQGEQYGQEQGEQLGQGASFTLSYTDLQRLNPMQIAADILRLVADQLCPPADDSPEETEF